MNHLRRMSLGATLAAAMLLPSLHARGSGAAASDPNVVSTRIDRVEGRDTGTRLLDARVTRAGGATTVTLVADKPLGTYELLELKNPARLAVDLWGVLAAPAPVDVQSQAIQGVRFGVHGDKVRVVFDGTSASLPAYELHRKGNTLEVVFAAPAPQAPVHVAATVPAPQAAPAPKAAAAPAQAKAAGKAASKVLDVAFQGEGAAQVVEVLLSAPTAHEIRRPGPKTVVLSLRDVDLPEQLVRSLDTTAFDGPVRTVSSFHDREAGAVRVVVALGEEAADRLEVQGNKLSWRFVGTRQAATIIDEAGQVTRAAADRSGPTGRYTGTRVSFEFKDIDIHNLLRVIAEVSKKNIVVADDVKGNITIRLRNVPWDQALDLILRSKGLGKEVEGNVIRIAPLAQLQAEREAAAKAEEAQQVAQPLRVRIIPVNYALAGEVAPKVQDLLTKRGSLTVDQRTNTLIIKDVSDVISRAEALIRSLDTQTPQVLISSRIVETSTNFARDLGIQWGGGFTANQASGNATGLAFPNSVAGTGAIPGAVGAGGAVPAQPNWAVSFPAGVGESSGGAVGFNFGSAGGAAQLNLRLTALETKGLLKTVSAPKVTTLDNREAVIGQGVSIPFSQVSAAGVNTVFVEAKLELRVTPHVTSDGSILMKIRASNNQPSENIRGANGQPAITKREAETEVLVKDGDTTVIGGIYTRRTSESIAQIPLLGDIPVLGWFFKSRAVNDERTELLIFVSPTIVNRDAALIAGG